jgi:hypothetical protein
VTTLQARGKAAARGGLQAVGVAMSPFRWQGRRLRFVEPPHMQVSMLWWPTDATVPSIGDAVEAIARMTTATFDRVEGLPG